MEQIIKRVNAGALRDGLAKALRKVEHGGLCYVVHRHDAPVAALVSMDVIRKYWDTEDKDRRERTAEPQESTVPEPEPEPEPEPQGYLRRLWKRRKRRADNRAAKAEEEVKTDRWNYRNMRGMDRGV